MSRNRATPALSAAHTDAALPADDPYPGWEVIDFLEAAHNLRMLGQEAETIPLLEEGVRRFGDQSAKINQRFGRALFHYAKTKNHAEELRLKREAVRYLEMAYRLNPSGEQTRKWLIHCYRDLGLSRYLLEGKIITLKDIDAGDDPYQSWGVDDFLNQAAINIKANRREAAIYVLHQAAARFGDDHAEIHFRLGRTIAGVGHSLREAFRHFEAAYQMEPDNAEYFHYLCEIYANLEAKKSITWGDPHIYQGRPAMRFAPELHRGRSPLLRSEDIYQRVAANDYYAGWTRDDFIHNINQWKSAKDQGIKVLKALSAAIRRFPLDSELRHMLGRTLLFYVKRPELASEQFEIAHQLSPEDRGNIKLLKRSFREAGIQASVSFGNRHIQRRQIKPAPRSPRNQ